MNKQLDIDKTPTILSKFKALFNWVNWLNVFLPTFTHILI